MDHAQLISHVDTDLVTRAQLRALPLPEPTPTFRPIPHINLIENLDLVLAKNQIRIRDEEYALRRDGSTLFGVLQLAYGESPMALRLSDSEPRTTRPWPCRFARDCLCLSATISPSAGT